MISSTESRRRGLRRALGAGCACLLLAGCGSSAGLSGGSSKSGSGKGSTSTAAAGGTAGMAGMGSSANLPPKINGVPRPVASQVIASADWQGMSIQARTTTPIPFLIFNGTSEQEVKPPKHASFHLMVMLSDAHTGVAIPYASVWATIMKGKKVVYDERQWPMISAYMGPHYGNDVTLPGPGRYTLQLLITPPVSARHVEYQHVWLKPHRVTETFTWNPAA